MRFAHVLIMVVAAIAMLIMLPIAAALLGFIHVDDEFYPASSPPIVKSWVIGSSPKVIVDNFDGYVFVERSTDGKVTASIEKFSLCKNLSSTVAKDSLRFVQVEMVQDDKTIRIVGRPTEDRPINDFAKTGTYINVEARIRLRVPDGATLELTTGSGEIRVAGGPHKLQARSKNGILTFNLDSGHGAKMDLGEYQGRPIEVNLNGDSYVYEVGQAAP